MTDVRTWAHVGSTRCQWTMAPLGTPANWFPDCEPKALFGQITSETESKSLHYVGVQITARDEVLRQPQYQPTPLALADTGSLNDVTISPVIVTPGGVPKSHPCHQPSPTLRLCMYSRWRPRGTLEFGQMPTDPFPSSSAS
ncbi:hypothetical protein GE21DRAFT_1124933 [Neurospora crassa]|nr:hypothetical protein GE21DRAFT_1124933 [Neurospora crassa]